MLKVIDDPLCQLGADTFEKTGTKVTHNAFESGGFDTTGVIELELATKAGVVLPAPVQSEFFAGLNIEDIANDGNGVFYVVHLGPHHCVMVLSVDIHNALDQTSDRLCQRLKKPVVGHEVLLTFPCFAFFANDPRWSFDL